MTIRTFRAPTVGEALAQVKKELGGGAVILHTRTYKVGGVLGVGARSITEITATSQMHLPPRNPAPSRGRAEPAAAQVKPGITTPAAGSTHGVRKDAPEPAPSPRVLPPRPAKPLVPTPVQFAPSFGAAPSSAPARPDELIRTTDSPLAAQIRDEMAMLRKLVARMAVNGSAGAARSKRSTAPGTGMTDPLASAYLRMIEADMASEIADEIINDVRQHLPPAELTDPERVRAEILVRLAKYVPAAESPSGGAMPPRPRDGRPLTIALVGPTGVGKTTTIAKLAATYKLRLGCRVGLVTADTYRIAAVEQLRTYAGIIGLPLKVVLTPAEMRAACDALRDCDIILLDTAGRSPSDAGRLGELGAFLDAALPHETHLVLSSASSESCLKQAARAFASVGPTHLIFTKLDEAVSFGVLVNIVRHINARLSYFTTGQEVPDHIEHASAPRLAGLILEGGAVR